MTKVSLGFQEQNLTNIAQSESALQKSRSAACES
jgi:hypothetical protein